MWNDSNTAPNPSLAHGLEGFIYQPKPRGLSPVFRFSDSAARPQDPACSLPTPSSSPAPRSKDLGSCLTIEHLARCEAEHESSDTLGRALAALPPRSPGYRLVTLNREEEDEHILSARSFGLNDISHAYQRLRSGSSDRAVVTTKPPKVTKVAPRPSAQAYLTPPSSPETGPECDPAHDVDVDDLSLDTESTLVGNCPNEPAGSVGSKKPEVLSNITEEKKLTEDELLGYDRYEDDEYEDDRRLESNGSRVFDDESENESETLMRPAAQEDLPASTHLLDLRNLTASPAKVPDLTAALDLSSFPEWPVARGGFGEVWKGDIVCDSSGTLNIKPSNKRDGFRARRRAVAVKRLTVYTDAGEEGIKKMLKRTTREIYIWSRLRHRNVLPLLGICSFRKGMGIISTWQENGNATAWVNQNPGVNWLELCEGICAGLVYLHNNNVIHGDLRGANVLISSYGIPRLIDFGLATVVGGIPAFSASSTIAGTVRWMAPELQVAEGQGTTAASDVFAFGMTMLELFTGAPPFSEIKNDIAVLLKYQQGIRPSRPTDPGKNRENNNRLDERKNASICVAMDDNTWDLVQRCWNQDLRRRPTTRQVLKWFQPQRKQAR